LGSNQRRLSRRFYSPSLLTEEHGADQHIRASMRDFGLPPSAMRPWAPGSGDRAAHGRRRNGPRTDAEEATDGAGGSGYADRLALLLAPDLLLQASCVGRVVMAGSHPVPGDRPQLVVEQPLAGPRQDRVDQEQGILPLAWVSTGDQRRLSRRLYSLVAGVTIHRCRGVPAGGDVHGLIVTGGRLSHPDDAVHRRRLWSRKSCRHRV